MNGQESTGVTDRRKIRQRILNGPGARGRTNTGRKGVARCYCTYRSRLRYCESVKEMGSSLY
jgi:hypothetical protein